MDSDFASLFSASSSTRPNIIIFIVDDMPFLKQFSDSAPVGVDLNGYTVEYGDYPTPYISEFRDEAVIFPKSFVAGPKCAPSRYSILTGRMPSRGLYAIDRTLETGDGSDGVSVTVQYSKLYENDTVYNLPRVLQDNGYYTGTVGKWHLLTSDDNGYDLGCSQLASTGDASLYSECTDIVKEGGFDYVDGWYYSNVVSGGDFSHNPEWLVSRAQHFIDSALEEEEDTKPFFLYFASTLTHDSGDVFTALHDYSYTDSPKGTLSGDEVPDDTTMNSREEIWEMARESGQGESFEVKKEYAMHFWVDEQFGALVNYLKEKGIYDETLIILQSDHGVPAKGTLYEHGSRIWNFMRYPPLFGKTQTFLHEDLVVSNVDLAPTIFNLIDATVPEEYKMDGTSWLHAVESTIDTVAASLYGGDVCCQYRFIDMYNSRSIVSADYQYIWRMNDELEANGGVTDLYVNVHDTEQLYDLKKDPNEQINVIDDESYSEVISEMQWLMREYIASTCPMEDGECLMPSDPYTYLESDDGSDLVYSAASTFGEMDLWSAKQSGWNKDDGSNEEWPSKKDTKEPTKSKDEWPTPKPTWPTEQPTKKQWPSPQPTKKSWPTPPPSWPTKAPKDKEWPSKKVTKEPTKSWPTESPTDEEWPSKAPTKDSWPTPIPSEKSWPTPPPSTAPTDTPTDWPTPTPTSWPTESPTKETWPTPPPSWPTKQPSNEQWPSKKETREPTKSWPTKSPTKASWPTPPPSWPTEQPSKEQWPSKEDTKEPTKSKEEWPTPQPTKKNSWPTESPTEEEWPSKAPTKDSWPTPIPSEKSWPTPIPS